MQTKKLYRRHSQVLLSPVPAGITFRSWSDFIILFSIIVLPAGAIRASVVISFLALYSIRMISLGQLLNKELISIAIVFGILGVLNFSRPSIELLLLMFYFSWPKGSIKPCRPLRVFHLWILLVGLICRCLVYYNPSDFRQGFGTDPNFFGIFSLLTFCIIFNHSKFAQSSLERRILRIVSLGVFSGISYFTASRLSLLGVFIFIVLSLIYERSIGSVKNRLTSIAPFSFLLIFYLLAVVCLVSWSSYALASFNFIGGSDSATLLERSSSLSDYSNQGRWLANVYWFDQLISNPDYLMSGLVGGEDAMKRFLIPHNSFIYAAVASSVLFSGACLVFVSLTIKSAYRSFSISVIPVSLTFVVGSLFLHGFFSAYPIFMLYMALPSPLDLDSPRKIHS